MKRALVSTLIILLTIGLLVSCTGSFSEAPAYDLDVLNMSYSAADRFLAELSDDDMAYLFRLADIALLSGRDMRRSFTLPDDINSNDLLNVFIAIMAHREDAESYKEADGLYHIPVGLFSELLGRHFESFSFDPGRVNFPVNYDPVGDSYITSALYVRNHIETYNLDLIEAEVLSDDRVRLTVLNVDTWGDPPGRIPVRLSVLTLRVGEGHSYFEAYEHIPVGDYPRDAYGNNFTNAPPQEITYNMMPWIRLISLFNSDDGAISFRSTATLTPDEALHILEAMIHYNMDDQLIRDRYHDEVSGRLHIPVDEAVLILESHLDYFDYNTHIAPLVEPGTDYIVSDRYVLEENENYKLLQYLEVGASGKIFTVGFYDEDANLASTYTLYISQADNGRITVLSGYKTRYTSYGSRIAALQNR